LAAAALPVPLAPGVGAGPDLARVLAWSGPILVSLWVGLAAWERSPVGHQGGKAAPAAPTRSPVVRRPATLLPGVMALQDVPGLLVLENGRLVADASRPPAVRRQALGLVTTGR